MKPAAPTDRPLPVYEIPEYDLPEWPADLRITCAGCTHRNGYMCQVTKRTHVPVEVKHDCGDYLPRIARLPAR